jgi:DNA polymerase (family 10)
VNKYVFWGADMNKKEVAKILAEIGTILDLKGENQFKTRAYHNGARIIETMDQDLEKLVSSGEISDIKGIGRALSDKISILMRTGRLPYHEELKSSIPEGLLDILNLPGLGAKKVKIIYDELNVTSIGELEYACKENRLRDLSGFGQKSQEKILDSIEMRKKYNERFLYPAAEMAGMALLNYLNANKKIIKLELAGSLRRKLETVKDIDIIACCKKEHRDDIMEYFSEYEESLKIISKGNTKSSMILSSGIAAEIRLVDEHEFPYLLQYNTGSKEHNTHLRRIAKEKGFKLNEYGLFKGNKFLECRNEEEIYRQLDMEFIVPELRENLGEIEAAQEENLPELYTGDPLYGLLHVHTTYSDGANSIQEIADACESMGMNYVGICDHSRSAFYANGLSEERIIKQHQEIEHVNEKNPDFKIFKGIEVDILPDGSLDYDNDILSRFDFVIASIHSNFRLSEAAQTKRICQALKNEFVTMLGHPTGRLLLAREGYALDMEEVLSVAGQERKAVETNSSPHRLDLDWRWGKLAQKHGIKTALNPDAHSVEGLKDFRYGVAIVRKGWFQPKDVLNSFTKEEIQSYFQKK